MKKLIAVSLTVIALIKIYGAPYVMYRSFFNPSGSSCWDGGYQYFSGGGHQTLVNNSTNVYQINPGDRLEIWIKSKCCGTGDPQHGILVGDTWEQYSTDNGVTWNPVIGSSKPVYVPQDSLGESYIMNNDSNGIQQNNTIQPCP